MGSDVDGSSYRVDGKRPGGRDVRDRQTFYILYQPLVVRRRRTKTRCDYERFHDDRDDGYSRCTDCCHYVSRDLSTANDRSLRLSAAASPT